MNTIKTDRLVIRPVEHGDVEAIHVYAGDKNIDMMMFLPNETLEETENFVKFATSEWAKEEPNDREYVVLLNGEIIGASNLEKCENRNGYEIGWIIRQDKRGMGFASEAAKALMAYAFYELKADFVQAHCDSRNAASEGVMKKLGMTLIDGTGTRTYEKTGVTSGEYLYAISRVEYICAEFVKRSKDIMKDNLKGIYLHGSSVMGCFNPAKSDIDLIVVTEDEMSDDTKRKYMDMVMKMNAYGPKKGIEMSVVRRKDCDPFIYPTPFDLHFSVAQIKWYTENPEDYIDKMKGTDADLAAHFTIIRKRGKCLYGLPIEQVFGEVPKADYFDSIWEDIADAKDDIKDNPMYIILNLTRVLAYKKEEIVLSKKEGGQWGLDNLPEEYHKLINTALREYEEGTEAVYDMKCAESYAEYMLREISQQ